MLTDRNSGKLIVAPQRHKAAGVRILNPEQPDCDSHLPLTGPGTAPLRKHLWQGANGLQDTTGFRSHVHR